MEKIKRAWEKRSKIALILFVPLVYFLVSLITLKDYGVSWDEPLHFSRGQAYFHYLRTGSLNYSNLDVPRRSYYQIDSLAAGYFLENDSAHPPANDIMAAFINYIFYQKLGWMGDIEALHLFNVLASTMLVLIVTIFAYETIGFWGSLVSGIVVATYPLLFAEGHFNIKDPAETAFFTLTIYLFWKSLKSFDWKVLFLAALSSGLALGIKFNIIFLPFIILPYLVIRYWRKWPKVPKAYYLALFLSPVFALLLFYFFWPYLWNAPFENFITAVKYYREIGTGAIGYQAEFAPFWGINFFPPYWILISTPPLVIFLTGIGVFVTLLKKKTQEKTEFLWLLFLLVPVLRAMFPDTTVYGGVRQIMEFIPGMALIAGLGASSIIKKLQFKIYRYLFLTVASVVLVIPLILLHPNENVYFNFLIGGLSGAKEKQVPYRGNSFGNAYLQAVRWLNEKAGPGAKLALVQGTSTNIPRIYLRSDLSFSNGYWSGIDRSGEYLIELTHDDPVRVYPYVWGYVEKFLKPVYEVRVDGIAIAKVWKNDFENTQVEFQRKEIVLPPRNFEILRRGQEVLINFHEPLNVTRVKFNFETNLACTSPEGYVEILGENNRWGRIEEQFPASQMERSYNKNDFSYFFLGDKILGAKFVFEDLTTCALVQPKIEVKILE